MAQYEPWVDWVLTNADRTTTLVRTEQQLAVTDKLEPCEYFDKRVDPWLRVVADVLKVRGDLARIVDWKTGKVKNDSEQLELSASVVFSHFPEVQRVMTNFVWLQENFKTDLVIERSDQKFFWARMLPQVDEMKLARVTGNFPAKPSGLCIRHCPVTGCPYHGKGNRG
jgi:hypothetical protein